MNKFQIRASAELCDLASRPLDLADCQQAVHEFCRCNRLVSVPVVLDPHASAPAALVGAENEVILLAQAPIRFRELFAALYALLRRYYGEQYPLDAANRHWHALHAWINETRARLQQRSKRHVPTRMVGDLGAVAELAARERLWVQGRQRQRQRQRSSGKQGKRLHSARLSPWYSVAEQRLLLGPNQ